MFLHYTNTPIIYQNDSEESIIVPKDNKYDVSYGMQVATDILKDYIQNPLAERKIKKGLLDSLMMRYLIHLVGDLHQPLHTSTLFSEYKFNSKIRKGDVGGNLIPIFYPKNPNLTNLHALWDSGLDQYNI